MWRKRRKYVRSNGGFGGLIPSMRDVKSIVTTGATLYAGYVGVNAALMGLDMIGFAKLKEGRGPLVAAVLNGIARVVATGIVAKLGSKFLRLNGTQLAAGGAFNVIQHAVQDVVASGAVPVPAQVTPMLLGYDGYGDYVGRTSMSDYVGRNGMRGLNMNSAADGGIVLGG